jgi:hypothetical protein
MFQTSNGIFGSYQKGIGVELLRQHLSVFAKINSHCFLHVNLLGGGGMTEFGFGGRFKGRGGLEGGDRCFKFFIDRVLLAHVEILTIFLFIRILRGYQIILNALGKLKNRCDWYFNNRTSVQLTSEGEGFIEFEAFLPIFPPRTVFDKDKGYWKIAYN